MTESFDEKAETWDDEPRRVQLAETLFKAIRSATTLRSDAAALDVGCGTGLLTLLLAAHVRQVTGIDSSGGMLDVLTRKAKARGIGNIDSLQSDLTAGPLPAGPYNLITSAMALHHVADTERLLGILFNLLTSGGTVALADLDTEDGSFHGSMEGIPHAGFDRETLSTQLATCGFEDIQFITATRIEKNDRIYPVFLVTAIKP